MPVLISMVGLPAATVPDTGPYMRTMSSTDRPTTGPDIRTRTPSARRHFERRTDRSAFVAIVLLTISLLLMTFDVRSSNEGIGATLRNVAQFLVAPIQAGVNAVITPIVEFTDGLANLAGLREENQRLRDRIAELEAEVIHVDHLEARLGELNTLLGLRLADDLQELAVTAEVTGRAGTLDPTLIIDRGTDDGVHAGQPVIDSQGALVGVVSEATERVATVTPITSRRAPGVTVRLADGRRGIVEGLGTGTLELSILDAGAPVHRGELLATYGPFGDSNSYPKGLDVGTVIASASPRSGVVRVEVDPVGDVDRLEYVAVIPWPPAPDQIEADREAGSEGSTAADGESEPGPANDRGEESDR